jgi:hypothetical protein
LEFLQIEVSLGQRSALTCCVPQAADLLLDHGACAELRGLYFFRRSGCGPFAPGIRGILSQTGLGSAGLPKFRAFIEGIEHLQVGAVLLARRPIPQSYFPGKRRKVLRVRQE